MTAAIQSACARAADTTRDLRLTTSLRRDAVWITTRWLPVSGVYESLVYAPDAITGQLETTALQTADRDEASRQHDALVQAVTTVLRPVRRSA